MINPRPGMFGPPMPPTHMMAGGLPNAMGGIGMGPGMVMGMLGMGMPMMGGAGVGTGPMPGAPLGMHARPMAPINMGGAMGMANMPGMQGMPMAGGPMSNMGYGRFPSMAPNSAAH